MEDLVRMAGNPSIGYPAQVLAASAAKDMCLVLGRPIDPSVAWTGAYLRDAAVTQAILSDPVPTLPLPVVADICGMPYLLKVPDPKTFEARFGDCLRGILAEELPKGRMSQLHPPRSMRTDTVLLFDGFAYDGDPQTAEVEVLDLRGARQWRDFLQGLAATVCASIFWDWKRVPWQKALLLSDRHAEMVRDILAGRDPDGSDEDENSQDVYADDCYEEEPWQDDGFPLNPSVLEDPDASRTLPRRDALMAGIRAHAQAAGRRDVSYVPSGCRCASYDSMDDEQTAFYLSWRSQAVRGAYGDTDRGYLWLLLCETVSSDRDSDRRLRVLEGLYRAYGQSSDSVRRLIGRTCTDYAFMTDQDPLWYGYSGDRQAVLWMKLRLEPPGKLSMDLLDGIADVDMGKYLVDGDYDGALNAAVRAMDAYLRRNDGEGILEAGSRRTRAVTREILPDLIHGWDRYVGLNMCDIGRNSAMARLMTAAAKVAIRGVNSSPGTRRPNRPSRVDPDLLEAMEAAVDAWVSGRERRAAAERNRRDAMSIVLDREAVSAAETDLEAVRTLVGTEDEDLPVTEPEQSGPVEEPVTEPPATDGTQVAGEGGFPGLAHSLDDVQRGYLSACLDGDGDDFLRSSGRSRVSLEDSINEIAMDAVGDQVVQDGEVFQEYADDLRAVL